MVTGGMFDKGFSMRREAPLPVTGYCGFPAGLDAFRPALEAMRVPENGLE